MALIIFLRGVNVGGNRRLRPSIIARALSKYDVVNVGAAGTFVVRKPVPRSKFLADLFRQLPFKVEVAVCSSRDLLELETNSPFSAELPAADVVRFVSILSRSARRLPSTPIALPPGRAWLVRVLGSRKRFVFGLYRPQMKTIGYLGEIDKLFGAPAITRNWNTVLSLVRLLRKV